MDIYKKTSLIYISTRAIYASNDYIDIQKLCKYKLTFMICFHQYIYLQQLKI